MSTTGFQGWYTFYYRFWAIIALPVTLKKKYPLTWAYLLDNKEFLEGREDEKMSNPGWYAYGQTQALDVMPWPKIFTPDLAFHPSFSLDETGECYFTGGMAGGYGNLLEEGCNRFYVLGILNSKLCEWYMNQISPPMRGGWRSYESRFIKHIPIQVGTTMQKKDIIKKVEKIICRPDRVSSSEL